MTEEKIDYEVLGQVVDDLFDQMEMEYNSRDSNERAMNKAWMKACYLKIPHGSTLTEALKTANEIAKYVQKQFNCQAKVHALRFSEVFKALNLDRDFEYKGDLFGVFADKFMPWVKCGNE